jgi:H+/gluconate symporter-like permease
MLMTYRGISLFVVVFVIYPMGYAIYREANLPRTLLPGAIAYGAFGITMTCVPGTPQIQNIIPTSYYGTTAAAAPLMGLVAAVLIAVPGYIYLDWRIRCTRRKGLQFREDPNYRAENFDEAALPKWHWLCGLLPLIVVVLLLNLLPNFVALTASEAIVVALLGGIAVVCLMNVFQPRKLLPAVNAGANGSLTAIMNTACAVGFGSVVKVVPGFVLLKKAMLKMPGSILFSEAVAVNTLAGATGSASGGMSIALEALSPQYLEKAAQIGMDPAYLHRIASIASGGLDTLPHNGAVLTLLAVSNCTHKESYLDICVTSCIIPVIVSLLMGLTWGIFI